MSQHQVQTEAITTTTVSPSSTTVSPSSTTTTTSQSHLLSTTTAAVIRWFRLKPEIFQIENEGVKVSAVNSNSGPKISLHTSFTSAKTTPTSQSSTTATSTTQAVVIPKTQSTVTVEFPPSTTVAENFSSSTFGNVSIQNDSTEAVATPSPGFIEDKVQIKFITPFAEFKKKPPIKIGSQNNP